MVIFSLTFKMASMTGNDLFLIEIDQLNSHNA